MITAVVFLVWNALNRGFGQEILFGSVGIGVLGFGAFLAVFVLGFVANSFPACPHCRQPVNMPNTDGASAQFPLQRPHKPPKSCGYCGLDLTVPYDPDAH